ncbi:MAG: alanine--glyoxylate aminotransferase family protein [Clostridia bacterium]|nr:MAG: alanine--glyoxylate aminotransferase family protein [Clostridia bacterium]
MEKRQIILIPGPTAVPSRVLRAMGAPAINHRGPEFRELIVEVTAGLKQVYQTANDVLILTASGTGGMEAAVANFLSPGDKALVVSIGSFGDRFVKICRAFGVEAEILAYEWGQAANPQDVADRLAADTAHKIKAVLVQQNETSTGVLNDIQAIAAARGDHPALLIVDAISGLVAAELLTDAWGLDVVISGSQKAFMIPPGLAMVSVSPRAWEAAEKCTNSRYYFDLKEAKKFLEKGETPFTPAVSVLFGLRESLRMLADEGLAAAQERHALYRDMVRSGVRALDLELLADDAAASPAVTAVKVPAGLTPKDITGPLRERFGIVIAGGQGKLSDKIFRIGHLGYVQPTDILATFAALEMILAERGLPVQSGQAVAAAEEVLAGGI